MSDELTYHEGQVVIGPIHNIAAPPDVGLLTVKAVHYPGAQQLIVWLPQSGYFGYGALKLFGSNEALIENTSIRDRLNGSVQILFDTLAWPPGAYRLEIAHEAGWRHVAAFEKLRAGVAPPAPEPPPEPLRDPAPQIYRDGFGHIMPDLDLELRAQAQQKLAQTFSATLGPRLDYEGNFRAGTITYMDGERRIRFWHEMAGAPYKFFIDIPSAAQWEAATGVPLAERDAIVRFVAETVQREQASSWSFEIRDTDILFR